MGEGGAYMKTEYLLQREVDVVLAALTDLGYRKDQVYTTLELRMKCGIGKCGR